MERSGQRFEEKNTNKVCKIAAQKKVFGKFCLTEQDFFGIGVTIHIGQEIFVSRMRYFFTFINNLF